MYCSLVLRAVQASSSAGQLAKSMFTYMILRRARETGIVTRIGTTFVAQTLQNVSTTAERSKAPSTESSTEPTKQTRAPRRFTTDAMT